MDLLLEKLNFDSNNAICLPQTTNYSVRLMEFKVSTVDSISIVKCSVFRGIYLIEFSSSLSTVMEHPWPYKKFHSYVDPDGGGA